MEFQSLFFWMMPTGHYILPLRSFDIQCFNPCSSGWCLPANGLSTRRTESFLFQSLFFWMMPTGSGQDGPGWLRLDVSILVLLDDAYRLRTAIYTSEPTPSFNPCSSGWCLPAGAAHGAGSAIEEVSILVLLDDAYRQVSDRFNYSILSWFQSLFFWMMPTGKTWLAVSPDNIAVSILVLLDDAYRRRAVCATTTRWKCFNPCSSGWCLPA